MQTRLYTTIFHAKNDVFYRFINDRHIHWRYLAYSLNQQIICKVHKKSEIQNKNSHCLIIDDSDFIKTGWHIELIGKIYSHVTKALFMSYHDGLSFFGLDFSLHGEKGKNKKILWLHQNTNKKTLQ